MNRVTIITSGSPSNIKGVMNYVLEEAKRLNASSRIDEVNVFLIRSYPSRLFGALANRANPFKKRENRESIVTIDGVSFYQIWHRYGLIDNIVNYKVLKKLTTQKLISQCKKAIGKCDIVLSHTLVCHSIAYQLGIPYICTWHGSDINVDPFHNKVIFDITKQTMSHAKMNYFVSQALLNNSNRITTSAPKDVIYTGPSNSFRQYSKEEIEGWKKHYGIEADVIVGFVGNIIEIKNVLVIPEIVEYVQRKLKEVSVLLVIAGKGNLKEQLQQKLDNKSIKHVFLGDVQPNDMPSVMNCLDVLLLPSKSEGMPLVTLEALTCGVNVVASDVGGISESIGKNNCFALDDQFVKNCANRIVEIVESNTQPPKLSDVFSWDSAINKICNSIQA